jgi:hypothetical protein
MWFLSRSKTNRSSSAVRRRSSYRPRFEPLEKRELLTAGALDTTFGSGGLVVKDYGQIDPNAARTLIPQNRVPSPEPESSTSPEGRGC